MRLFLAAVAILSIAQAVPIKNSKKNVDETAGSDLDPNNFLFVASHGKRSVAEEDLRRMMRPNGLIFFHGKNGGAGKRSSTVQYLPRPNNFLNPLKMGKRFGSPTSFLTPIGNLARYYDLENVEDDEATGIEDVLRLYDVNKFGKRGDDSNIAFDTFLGNRG